MPNYSNTVIMGHAGRDAEIRHTTNGKTIGRVSVAVTERYGDKEETTWFKLVAFGGWAENMHISKGDLVMAEGTVKLDKWETQDGKAMADLELRCNKVFNLSGRKPAPAAPIPDQADLDGDIPF